MEFRGWREYWLEIDLRSGVRLEGMHAEWESSVFEAKCKSGDILKCPMDAPGGPFYMTATTHLCGIHSFKRVEDLPNGSYSNLNVYAEVVNWGRVEEFEKGYRSQFCRILHLYLVCEKYDPDVSRAFARLVEAKFGVPVTVMSQASFEERFTPKRAADRLARDMVETTDRVLNGDAYLSSIGTMITNQMLARASAILLNGTAYITNTGFEKDSSWLTSDDGSSGTTTYQNQSKRQSGSRSRSKKQNQSKSAKKVPVAAKLPGNNQWWLRR